MSSFRNNKITIGKMTGARVGVSVPPTGLEGNVFKIGETENVETVFEVRGAPSLAARLGLPPDTSAEVLVELLKIAKSSDSPTQLTGNIEHSSAWKHLGRAANLTSVATALWDHRHEIGSLLRMLGT